ncbi:hypothetical protein BEP19_04960 [Ammoniphilus oxalaticus]|uniref:Thioesterase domain-containing protein n=1 Tax=Ammoniphilus oxalaticus TaxID=66863 RepID=A0A419SIK2_9BACL|nr:thioesterase family protein [Ammoniphilus oxalaticus]RKD23782.1 hypothetical protein BEP19_04960 [Ammoniphilus oxalaticus]
MFVSESELKVRYAETDAMEIVHHSSYIIWFEVGRTDFIDELGISYASVEEQGFILPVLDVHATYKKPLRYGETAIVKTSLDHYDGLRIRFSYQVLNKSNELCVEGFSSHVIVPKDTFKPIRLKNHLLELHELFEKVKKKEGTV